MVVCMYMCIYLQGVSKWLEQFQSAITAFKTHAEVSHMERNSRCSDFVRMRNPPPLFSHGLWRNRAIMATPEQKAFCVLRFVKHESVVSVQRAFRWQFNSDPPSPNSIRRWYQQFQTTGCLCKGKSAGQPRVSEESVERVRKKRNICRHLSRTCRVTLSFLLVFISLFTIRVNIINFQTAPIILIHPVYIVFKY